MTARPPHDDAPRSPGGDHGGASSPGDRPVGVRRRFARLNWQMFGKLAVVASVMFGFGWALIPIYRTICEVTGLNNLTQVDKGAQDFAANTQVDTSRKVTVEFDANARGPWRFKPEQVSLDVHPGELVTIVYEVQNTLDETVAGQAIPSYAPRHSEGYFRKLECFCFRQQTLAPLESKRFPVVFVIDPKLPSDVGTITLSYTLFKVDGPVGAVAPAPRPSSLAMPAADPMAGVPMAAVPTAAIPVAAMPAASRATMAATITSIFPMTTPDLSAFASPIAAGA